VPGHLNLDRRIDPHYTTGRILVQHIESGDVFTVTPIAGWCNERGEDWVKIACTDEAMKFRFLRDEIAAREVVEKAEPIEPAPQSTPTKRDECYRPQRRLYGTR
jgi:hypothetical protein